MRHRLVYGGREYEKPQLITPKLVEALTELVPFAPEHLPHELKAIQAIGKAHPGLPQVACFDTAFHLHSPKIAKLYPLPRHYFDEGLIRYGFHGLSYAYILQELIRLEDASAERRIIVAHLSNGASMTAVRAACPVDTTMGFTPSGGLMMSSRSRNLDPAAVFYFLERGLSLAEAKTIVNEQAGLLGVSGISSDMQDLLTKESHDRTPARRLHSFVTKLKSFWDRLPRCSVVSIRWSLRPASAKTLHPFEVASAQVWSFSAFIWTQDRTRQMRPSFPRNTARSKCV